MMAVDLQVAPRDGKHSILADFPKLAHGRLKLLLGFVAATEDNEVPQQLPARGRTQWVDLHQHPDMRKRGLRLRCKAMDQRGERLRLEAAYVLALGDAPRLEIGQVGKIEALQKLSAERADKPFERVNGKIAEPPGIAPERHEVDVGAERLECDRLAIGDDAARMVVVDQGP